MTSGTNTGIKMKTQTEIKLEKVFNKWQKEIGADNWSVWDSITTDDIMLFGRRVQEEAKLSQHKADIQEICECGHDITWHTFIKPPACDYDDCPCKKFTPKIQIPEEELL